MLNLKWRVQRLLKTQPLVTLLSALVALIFVLFVVFKSASFSSTSMEKFTSMKDYKYKPKVDWKPKNKPIDHITHYNLNSFASESNGVLILSPMASFNTKYWENLISLSYPKNQIDLGFIIPRTLEGDQTLKDLEFAINTTSDSSKFNKITILRQDEDSLLSQSESKRHAFKIQKFRRGLMAQARNSLLTTTMAPYINWVLWLDADIIESPKTLIQDMIKIDKPVLAANCFQRFFAQDKGKDSMRPYDFNNWNESDEGLKLASTLKEDEIIIEGYAEMATYRALMGHFYVPHGKRDTFVPLDGVGGTCLLVNAQVHRDGANFPTFPFKHLIETEGFAMMAKKLGYGVFGLPNYLVFHLNE